MTKYLDILLDLVGLGNMTNLFCGLFNDSSRVKGRLGTC